MNMQPKKVGVGFGVFMLRDGNVLLGKRHVDPAKADSELHGEGTWTMPGGKLEFGETLEEGAAREVLEETGVRIEPADVSVMTVSNDMVPDAHFVTIGLMCQTYQGEPKVMEPDEITEWKWFPLDALPEPLFPPSLKIIENYRKGAFYTRP